jgi:integrase/recombinase XerD
LDRNEVGPLLVAAGLGAAAEHALISLLEINGLRISEALGADIDDLGVERGHRTLTVLRKGGKIVTIPLAPRTARSIDLAIGERLDGPIFLRADGQRMDRHCASRIVRRVARHAGLDKKISPHTLRHALITAALDPGVPLRDVQDTVSHADPRTTLRDDRARVSLDRHATYIVAAYLAGAARRTTGAALPPGARQISRPLSRSFLGHRGAITADEVATSGACRLARWSTTPSAGSPRWSA